MQTGLAKGLSLWLMPEVEQAVRFAAWIEGLAAVTGGERYPPHLTLLSALEATEEEALAAAARTASGLSCFRVRFDAVEERDEYFRRLFLRAVADQALRDAHAIASRAFGREPAVDFLPHLSLAYGERRPEQARALALEPGRRVDVGFEARRLHLWRTQGPVAAWCGLAAFDLLGLR